MPARCLFFTMYLWRNGRVAIARECPMADVSILKFNVGSPTDQTLLEMQVRFDASKGIEARRWWGLIED